MYDVGKVIYTGGGEEPVLDTSEAIDLNAATPTWSFVAPMPQARRQQNATILPDGRVLVTGGSSSSGSNTEDGPKPAIVWDPDTNTWTTWATEDEYRGYHSEALLLPDARVASIGGDGHPSLQVFSPPYLFNGPRPTITSAPSSVQLGETFFVETPDSANITQVTWVRPSAVTHTKNMNQRINKSSFTPVSGGLDVTAPSNANFCPPGHYMLFILNGTGVPSVAQFIQVGIGGPTPPDAPIGLTASPGDARVDLTWNAFGADSYNVKRSTTSGGPYSTIATGVTVTSYTDTTVSTGTTYYYVVSAVNSVGRVGVRMMGVRMKRFLFLAIVLAISGFVTVPQTVVAPALIAHAAAPVTFIGAGDIASQTWSSSSRHERTAEIIEQAIAADPSTVVWTTGDNAYSDGTAGQFATKYDPSWGRFRNRTRPVAGNHDWHSTNAQPYLDYLCPKCL